MYVIIGANGFLGSYFIKNILEKTDEEILATDLYIPEETRSRVHWMLCDITKDEDIEALNEGWLRKNKENKVVFLAAYHNPDLVAKNPKIAWNINVTSLSRCLNSMENVKRLVYPSSDSVYGESVDQKVFREEDALNPVNRYGMQKTVAEKLVTAYGYNVVRFPFLIGPSLLPHKKHFYDVIVETITSGKTMDMFFDSSRSAVTFNDAARIVVELMQMEQQPPQILNICGDDPLSKYEIGLRIARRLGVDEKLIVPASVADNSAIFETKRASSTIMDNSKLKQVLGLDRIDLDL